MSSGKAMKIHLINGQMKMMSLYKMSYYSKAHNYDGNGMKVKLICLIMQ